MYNDNRTKKSPILSVIIQVINPLIPKTDLLVTSPYNIHALFRKQLEDRRKKFEKFMSAYYR